MPRATSTAKPKPKAAPRKRCQWCPNYLMQHGPARRKILVCTNCDNLARWPNV